MDDDDGFTCNGIDCVFELADERRCRCVLLFIYRRRGWRWRYWCCLRGCSNDGNSDDDGNDDGNDEWRWCLRCCSNDDGDNGDDGDDGNDDEDDDSNDDSDDDSADDSADDSGCILSTKTTSSSSVLVVVGDNAAANRVVGDTAANRHRLSTSTRSIDPLRLGRCGVQSPLRLSLGSS